MEYQESVRGLKMAVGVGLVEVIELEDVELLSPRSKSLAESLVVLPSVVLVVVIFPSTAAPDLSFFFVPKAPPTTPPTIPPTSSNVTKSRNHKMGQNGYAANSAIFESRRRCLNF